MSERAKDEAWEALVAATNASIPSERGALNAALRDIRAAMPKDVTNEELGREITYRAGVYRKVWPEMALTATSLSKHWARIVEQSRPVPAPKPPPEGWALCGLCLNDGWLLVEGTNDSVPCPECLRGSKAEVAAYGAEGRFWQGKHWVRSKEPQTVLLT